jgi:hypothetical protein
MKLRELLPAHWAEDVNRSKGLSRLVSILLELVFHNQT